MEQWNVEAFKDRAKKFTEDARTLSNDFQYAIGLREKQKEGEDMKGLSYRRGLICRV